MADGDSDQKLRYAIGFCLFAATIVTYSSVVHHEFVDYDDYVLLVNNPNLTRPATLANLLSHFYVPYEGNLLPFHWISMQLGMALHGPEPAAFLLTNVFIHAISSAVLFAALGRLTGSVWRSAFVAAVFALHPLHVESVAWVSERKDVLAGLFFMLGLFAYALYTENPRSKARYVAVLLCLTFGLLSKSTLVTFPAVLLLLDVWPLDRVRREGSRVLLEKVPMFALVALASGVTFFVQRAARTTSEGAKMGFGSRLSNSIESYWNYLYDAVWPTGLAVLYPHPYLRDPLSTQDAITAAGLGVALIGLTVVILMASRKRPFLGVGWLWYLGMLVPMIGLVQVGVQARADRYMYLPLVGLSIALAWGMVDLVAPKRRHLLAALSGTSLIALAIVTRFQLEHWTNTMALFERAVAVTEGNRFAHVRLGFELTQIDRHEEGREHYRAAIEIEPDRAQLYNNLAISYEQTGDIDAAVAARRDGLLRQNSATANGELGLLLLRAGRPDEAKRYLLIAMRAIPDSIEYRKAFHAAMNHPARKGFEPR